MSLKNIVIAFFAINAVFWSFFPHTVHCNVVEKIGASCVGHHVHLVLGVVSYIVAFVIAQKGHLGHSMK